MTNDSNVIVLYLSSLYVWPAEVVATCSLKDFPKHKTFPGTGVERISPQRQATV